MLLFGRLTPNSGGVKGSGTGVGRMSRRPRRVLLWLVPVAVAALTVAMAGAAPAGAQPATATRLTSAADGPGSAGCAARVNDTPRKLLECIRTEDLWRHMKAFQAIADANPGPDGHPSRNSGEPGYKASVDYVAKLMRQAGYKSQSRPTSSSTSRSSALRRSARCRRLRTTSRSRRSGTPAQSTGTARRRMSQPAGGIVIPPTAERPAPSSGCTAD